MPASNVNGHGIGKETTLEYVLANTIGIRSNKLANVISNLQLATFFQTFSLISMKM